MRCKNPAKHRDSPGNSTIPRNSRAYKSPREITQSRANFKLRKRTRSWKKFVCRVGCPREILRFELLLDEDRSSHVRTMRNNGARLKKHVSSDFRQRTDGTMPHCRPVIGCLGEERGGTRTRHFERREKFLSPSGTQRKVFQGTRTMGARGVAQHGTENGPFRGIPRGFATMARYAVIGSRDDVLSHERTMTSRREIPRRANRLPGGSPTRGFRLTSGPPRSSCIVATG